MLRKAVVKGSVFIILLLVVISILNSIFVIKNGYRSKLVEGLYHHSGNSFDVVLMGSSHMQGAIDPNVLWHQQGITSYNYAIGGQPIDVTYYVLKEVLKKHNPSIVVVDLYYLGLTDEYGDEGYIRNTLDHFNFSVNKLEAILNCTPPKDRMYYFVPFLKYHDRWKELTMQDILFDSSSNYYAKGFVSGTEKYGKDYSSYSETTGTVNIPPKTEKYLSKIIDLSQREGFKLILTNIPYDYNSTAGSISWVKEPAKMFNKVSEIAEKHNIPFINYNDKLNEIGYDFQADMHNSSHVNIWGANKVSVDLGKFLKSNYTLVDHRSDSKYAQWNEDYKRSQAASIAVED